jgi:hypothetical protein
MGRALVVDLIVRFKRLVDVVYGVDSPSIQKVVDRNKNAKRVW